MTGILPIAKYSSGSELNMFFEFSMVTMEAYSEFYGFTDDDVDALYQKYLQTVDNHKVTREGLKIWYDGYLTVTGRRLYNPHSVVGALTFNQLGSYWTSSGPYDEIFYYIGANTDAVKEDVALMVADNPDLKALDYYRIEREDKAGTGYVDFIFYPFRKNDDVIILELKVDHTVDEAIQQIKDRQYALRFEGKFGENPEYTGRILAVGIAYNKNDKNKRHMCKVEVLREALKKG